MEKLLVFLVSIVLLVSTAWAQGGRELVDPDDQNGDDIIDQAIELTVDCEEADPGRHAAGECRNYFIECENRQPVVYLCNGDGALRFNSETLECSTIDMIPECIHEIPPIEDTCIGRPTGFHPHPDGDCTKYAFCVEDLFYSVNCEENTVFDVGSNRCTPTEMAMAPCGTYHPPTFTCEGRPSGFYRSGMDCRIYYECEDGKSVIPHACRFLSAFDLEDNQCKSIFEVSDCAPPTDLSLGEQFCAIVDRDDVYAHPHDCGLGIVCIQGVAIVSQCQKAEFPFFDPVQKECLAEVPGCDDSVPPV